MAQHTGPLKAFGVTDEQPWLQVGDEIIYCEREFLVPTRNLMGDLDTEPTEVVVTSKKLKDGPHATAIRAA